MQGIRLSIVPNCAVEIESFADPLCTTEAAINSPQVDNVNTIATIFGATFGALIVIIVVACALVMFCRVIKRLKSKHPRLAFSYMDSITENSYWRIIVDTNGSTFTFT